jgi:hypothetical protein
MTHTENRYVRRSGWHPAKQREYTSLGYDGDQ